MNSEKPTKPLKVAIQTFGCQMNMYDTEVAEGVMSGAGFEIIREGSEEEGKTVFLGSSTANPEVDADVFLMNTCSVREHAEERVWGRLGILGKVKRTNPDLVVGLMGCMVEEHREKLFKRFPQLDLMVGTRNIKELPALVEQVRATRRQVASIKQEGLSIEYTEQIQRKGLHHAWLPVMTGCNKVCTFCIVPITRGSEVSMPAREVYREASRLAGEGVKWITLLGQNVNSYDPEGISTFPRKDNSTGFPELLDSLCKIDGIEKISFTTSHPHDATEELYKVIAANPKISRRFHLPLQSGSSRMLKRMKRLHTYEEYVEKIHKMREMIPEISITTDIIAGFSGETDEDHQATARALQEIRFDKAYIYKYSVRPGTPAAKLPDDVSMQDKEARNAELIVLQDKIGRENNLRWLGKTVEVFAEEMDERNSLQVKGRTSQEKAVVFPGTQDMIGRFIPVKLKDLTRETFLGEQA